MSDWYKTATQAAQEELALLKESIRKERGRKIEETDYLIMPDYPITEDSKNMVLEYRQALRDIPQQEGFPNNIEWPQMSEIERSNK